jgi:hypothetical protein
MYRCIELDGRDENESLRAGLNHGGGKPTLGGNGLLALAFGEMSTNPGEEHVPAELS